MVAVSSVALPRFCTSAVMPTGCPAYDVGGLRVTTAESFLMSCGVETCTDAEATLFASLISWMAFVGSHTAYRRYVPSARLTFQLYVTEAELKVLTVFTVAG